MTVRGETPRSIADAMLAMVDPSTVKVTGGQDRFAVTIAGADIGFDADRPEAYELLASAIEAGIAYTRAVAMVSAAGESGVPLWLVAGSDILGKWLGWSRTDSALTKVLTLTDQPGGAPVVGNLARRARHDLGQMAARIRVRAGQAVAERIEFSHRVPAILMLGERAILRMARQRLPENIAIALQKDRFRNDRWRASDLIDHPFFAGHDLMVDRLRSEGDNVLVELETRWAPLAPIPKPARTAVPRGANPAFPWRATPREVADLYALAGRGSKLIAGLG